MTEKEVVVHLGEEPYRNLEGKAAEEGKTVSEFVTGLVLHYLDNEKRKGKGTRREKVYYHGLAAIEGIGPVYAGKLRAGGIGSVEALLEAGATPEGRRQLEEKTDVAHKLILEWVNLADLMRIKGIGEEYSDLLEEAGVDAIKELRHRVPANLHEAIVEVNEAKKLVRRLPTLTMVADWIEQAKRLPPKVTY